MKDLYIILIIIMLFPEVSLHASWLRQDQNNPNAGVNQQAMKDSLPAGVTEDWMNELKDENGNRIIPASRSKRPEEEGDVLQQKIFNGFAAGDRYGSTVASAGDVNGDGFDDVIIGAPLNDGSASDAGRVYIYYGGIIMNTIPDVILSGEAINNYFGWSVLGAGDVNGDGYSDVIVGAYGYSSFTGRAYIFYGGSAMNNVADVTTTGEAANHNFGWSVSGADDVNGDGYADVIVGAQAYNSSTGRTYIFYGGTAMNNVADVTMTGEASNNFFGVSVSGAGDVNGDGFSDVIVGAYGYNSNTGRAYIFYGGAVINNAADVTMTGETAGNAFGVSVSGAGDVNGDGYSDVIVGAYAYSSNTGRAYIFYGGSVMNNVGDVPTTGEAASNNFGWSVSGAGDVNGDGYSDVIVGAYGYSSSTGRTYIFYGGAVMNNTADVIMTGETAGNAFGDKVSGAGDINGDGYSDVIAGAYGYNSNTGRAYLYTNTMYGEDIPDIIATGEAASNNFGWSVSGAGDVNGDGYSDVIVGANGYSSITGRAYIFYGGAVMNNAADVTMTGEATNDRFGYSVSEAGDVNGDGFSDVIVGAYGYSSSTGRAYIFYGGAAMNNVADVTMTGEASSNVFGHSVSGAGDINGDGYSDVNIGAYQHNSSTGRAYIFYGGAVMNNVADVTMTGEAASIFFGYSVSGAGDVNGDGYSDVIVGAFGYSSSTGRAYIFYGGAAMNNVADVTMTGEALSNSFGSVSGAGDVNGDGYSDVIVGAYEYSSVTGRAYIFYGGAVMNNVADVTMTGEAANNRFGISVSGAEDVNGDGYSDVIVGAYGYSSFTGRAYTFYGGAVMNNVADVTMTGEAAGNQFGNSVTGAGDVNGDGYSDVIVGAHGYSSAIGRAYIYQSSSPSVKPSIISVKDVPFDQGGFVNLRWARSGYDIIGQNIITGYLIERSLPPGGIGFAWNTVSMVTATKNPQYFYPATTLNDSMGGNSGTTFFRITAQTSDPNVFWRSNIMSGYSVDNLAPFAPASLTANPLSTSIALDWNQNLEGDLHHYIIYRNGDEIASSVNSDYNDASAIEDSSYNYQVAAVDIHGNISSLSNLVNVTLNNSGTLNLTVLMEGFYNSASNNMSISDTAKVYLRNSSSPYAFVDSSTGVINLNTFTGLFEIQNAPAGNYYIVIKHRNTIETWSNEPISYSLAGTINYDFTNSITQAFGSNMKQVDASPVRFGIFSGDVNQDDIVDLTDIINVFNDANTFTSGYVVTDLTGDNFVDLSDLTITFNNSNAFVTMISP